MTNPEQQHPTPQTFADTIGRIVAGASPEAVSATEEQVMETYCQMRALADEFASAMMAHGAGFDVLREESAHTQVIPKSFGRQQTVRRVDAAEVGGWIIREGTDYSGCSLRRAYRRDDETRFKHLDVDHDPWPLDARGRPLVSRYWYKAIAVLTDGSIKKVMKHGDVDRYGPSMHPDVIVYRFDTDKTDGPKDVFAWEMNTGQLSAAAGEWQSDLRTAAERYAGKPRQAVLHTYSYPATEE